jgi:hypothetical protein
MVHLKKLFGHSGEASISMCVVSPRCLGEVSSILDRVGSVLCTRTLWNGWSAEDYGKVIG